ncbi:ATP-binding cassette domain-containing protein [Halorientalis brevis]|uniref:ATP-binding cassette domain-containing protein n=1 Tax=Halorientalis brevis TaxID=1126241 RepID=A0ABD6C8S8_9EURY|nr:ABC transporter ATP-binding protein [Halorientalis brevis]
MAAIELDGVTKEFDAVTALRGVDLTVEEGEIFGFLGPNGAGKSTTIDVLLDFVRPTSGRATVLGHDAQAESAQVRARTGVLPEGFDVYDRLTARQHVEFVAESKDVAADVTGLLDRVGLADAADRTAGDYSKGMQQRLALAMALVGEPDLLILDEPTSGLDPNGAREMRELIRTERDRGATVFFSSHILGQVEAVCDRIAILEDGAVQTVDRVESLRADAGGGTQLHVTVESLPDGAVSAVRTLSGVSTVAPDRGAADPTVSIACADEAKLPALNALDQHGAPVLDFVTEEASLEDLFVEYTSGNTAQPVSGEGRA